MGVKVIQQSTSERNRETQEIFEKIEPLLKQGYSYHRSICLVKGLPVDYNCANQSWYKRIIEYGESQGYPRKNHMRSIRNRM